MREPKQHLQHNIILIIILLCEAIGFRFSIRNRGWTLFAYYTQISNMLTAVSVIVMLIANITNRSVKWITGLRYGSTCMLLLTVTITLALIAPSGQVPLGQLLFSPLDNGLYHHLICPILSIFSYIVCEDHIQHNSVILIPVCETLIYGIIMLTLNGLRIFVGPYPFLQVHDQSVFASIAWVIGILLLTMLLSALILWASKIRNKT
ncbi:MAG: hypothetical protein J6Y01_08335 [Spirochaetales bacterium]|nr:hypothetical protein [Spirochaetales bacterium]